jgi:hypothetical protein
MVTKLTPLAGEDRELLYEMAAPMFTEGECYAFAIALHRGLDWPIVGLMQGEIVRHALTRMPSGKLFDVRGEIEDERVGEPYLKPPYDLRDIDEKTLYAKRPILDGTIAHARKMAEALWPELPWKSTYAGRARIFADELETLCRRHGIWIRAPVPAQPPFLAPQHGEEGGYELRPTADGYGFTIDRYFK